MIIQIEDKISLFTRLNRSNQIESLIRVIPRQHTDSLHRETKKYTTTIISL